MKVQDAAGSVFEEVMYMTTTTFLSIEEAAQRLQDSLGFDTAAFNRWVATGELHASKNDAKEPGYTTAELDRFEEWFRKRTAPKPAPVQS